MVRLTCHPITAEWGGKFTKLAFEVLQGNEVTVNGSGSSADSAWRTAFA